MHKNNKDAAKKNTARMVGIGIAAAVLLLAGGWFVSVDLRVRGDFTELEANVKQIDQRIIAIDQAQGVPQKTTKKGDGVLSQLSCLPDLRCPYIQRTWYAPFVPGQEQQAIMDILQQAGYEPRAINDSCVVQHGHECYMDASNAVTRVNLAIGVPSSSDAPTKDLPPKVWRKVLINAELK